MIMRLVEGGVFMMGSSAFYPEEAPRRKVRVASFWVDETPVTNAQFAAFVDATGYRIFAETAPDRRVYPSIDPALALAGSLVFTMTDRPVDIGDPSQWWRWVVLCYPTLDRLRLEFCALLGPGGLVAPGECASTIGGIFPIALCGLSSLYDTAA